MAASGAVLIGRGGGLGPLPLAVCDDDFFFRENRLEANREGEMSDNPKKETKFLAQYMISIIDISWGKVASKYVFLYMMCRILLKMYGNVNSTSFTELDSHNS